MLFVSLLLLLADDEEGVLDRPSCLAALAALRHTKWFQVCKMLVCVCLVVFSRCTCTPDGTPDGLAVAMEMEPTNRHSMFLFCNLV